VIRLKIVIEELQPGEEEQIIIKCKNPTSDFLHIIKMLKYRDNVLTTYSNNEVHMLDFSEIFYIESVDSKTFVYCEKLVHESKYKLYELEEILAASSFLRVSKSVIINLKKIKILLPALSGRLEAVLRNGEKIPISRQYVSNLKKTLDLL